MPRALWLLLWLRFRSWGRRLVRNLRTVKGAVLALLGLMLFVPWLISVLFASSTHRPMDVETIRRFAPVALLGYCVLLLLTPSGERVISFTPAEVSFLFSGPFSRRQLLAYKIVSVLLTALLGAFFLVLWLRTYALSRWTSFVGVLLFLIFQQLLVMVVALATNVVGERAATDRRKFGLLILAALALAALLPLGREMMHLRPLEVLERVEQTPVAQVILAPFRWFVEAFCADRLWPDFLQAALRGLAVDGVLLTLVFVLDAQYLEAAAAVSERTYARLQRMRSGGGTMQWAGTGSPRFGVPALPWWGGAGPIAWRQLTTALRSLRSLLFFMLIFAAFMLGPLLFGRAGPHTDAELQGLLLASVLLAMTTFFLPTMITCDFRGDIDRFDVLKSLPIAPSRLALGQLVAPVLFSSIVQVVLLLVVQAVLGGIGWLLGLVVLFALPVNGLLFAIENLLFLWFPLRQMTAAGADFEMIGRYFVLLMLKGILVGIAVMITTVVTFVVYFPVEWVGGPAQLVAGIVAWIMLMGLIAALVPLLAIAFQQFDVARDTPP